ncbi:MAG: DNA recombination protein RmuC [Candidatus Pacebacteria bacterium]|nr:DNA recombination protein RmuC [Candidatus Paceibacterota bacterium]
MIELLLIIILLLGFFGLIVLQNKERREFEQRMTDLMSSHLKELRGNFFETSEALHKQMVSFTSGTVQVQENLKKMQETMQSISSFQEIFRSPKLRGRWGEASLEMILAEYYPKEFYKVQYTFSTGERADAVLKLPDGKLLAIDAKFSFENFTKMIEASKEEEKQSFKKRFLQDIKIQIDSIAQKYILPQEGTLEYALMYVPAEAVFYEILFNLKEDIGKYARKKKVVIASPNTIYLTLGTITAWFRDTQISRQTKEIQEQIIKIQTDAVKLITDFQKLGGHLKNASSSYDNCEKRFSFFTSKVKKLTDIKKLKK